MRTNRQISIWYHSFYSGISSPKIAKSTFWKIHVISVSVALILGLSLVDGSRFHGPVGTVKYHRTLFEKCHIDDSLEYLPAFEIGFIAVHAKNDTYYYFNFQHLLGTELEKIRILVPKAPSHNGGTNLELKDLVFARFLSNSMKLELVAKGSEMVGEMSFLLSEMENQLANIPQNFRVVLIAYGSDFDTLVDDDMTVLMFNFSSSTSNYLYCLETLAPACQAIEGSQLVVHDAFMGEPTQVEVVLGNPTLHFGSWVLRIEAGGEMITQQSLEWCPADRVMKTLIRFRKAAVYRLSAYLMFPNTSLAIQQIVGETDLDRIFCGERLKPVDLEVSQYCPSGNVMADWLLVRELPVELQSVAFLPPSAVFPLYEWTPRSHCQLRWFTAANLEHILKHEEIKEIIIMGDSREMSLFDGLKHIVTDQISDKSHADDGWKKYTLFRLCDVVAATIRTQEEYGKSTGPFQVMANNAIAHINGNGACIGNKKGVIFLSIPLFDVRHVKQFEENGMDQLISIIQNRCSMHEIVLLTMQGVHDDIEFLKKQPVRSFSWAPFQHRPIVMQLNQMIIETARKHKLKYCDLFAPTDTRPDATLDGVHYLLADLQGSISSRVLDGRNVTHILVQLMLNTIFPPFADAEIHV